MGQKNGPRTAECWRKQATTLLAKLVSVFRITAAADASGSYKDQLATKLEKLFQQSPYNATDIKLVAGATTWKRDNNLLALLGCLNLFLIHNPTHEFNALRAGSLIMHGKDCAVIPMVDYMSNLLNFHPDELLTLGVYRRLGEEILNLLEHLEGEEYSKPDSLFYYARAYGLMEKSPYSASASPNLFTFLNYLGGLRDSQRCLNAKLIAGAQSHQMFLNAVFLITETRIEEIPGLTATVKASVAPRDSTGRMGADVTSRLAQSIVVDINNKGQVIPENIRAKFDVLLEKFKMSRPGTIAQGWTQSR